MDDTLQCPACRKRQVLPLEKSSCSRCGLDLSSLVEVRDAASRLRQQAVSHVIEGGYEEALLSIEESWNLKNDPDSARLAYVLHLAGGDFDAADEWRSSAGI